MYLRAGDEPTLLKRMDIRHEPYTQLIVMDPRSGKYCSYVGAFRADDIASWVSDVVNGRVAAIPMKPREGTSETLSTIEQGTVITLENKGEKGDGKTCEARVEREKEKALKRAAALEAEKAKEKSAAASTKAKSSTTTGTNTVDPFAAPEDAEKWVRPHRPEGRQGFVLPVEDRTFNRMVLERNAPYFVRFLYAEDDLKSLSDSDHEKENAKKDAFGTTAKQMNSMARYVTVQCPSKIASSTSTTNQPQTKRVIDTYLTPKMTQHLQSLGDNAIHPKYTCGGQLLVFPPQSTLELSGKARDKDYYLYTGEHNVTALTNEALMHIKEGEVSIVTKDTFQKWVVDNILMPRLIIVTDKSEPPMLARALALEFQGFAAVGIVHSSQRDLMAEMQADRAPAVRILKPTLIPKPGDTTTRELQMQMVKFTDNALYFNAIASMLDTTVTTRLVHGPTATVDDGARKASAFGTKSSHETSPTSTSGNPVNSSGDQSKGNGGLSAEEAAEIRQTLEEMQKKGKKSEKEEL